MTYVQPLILVCLLAILAGLVRLRTAKGLRLPAMGLLALFLLAWPPVEWLLSRPLEAGYPVKPVPSESAQAIVVLSSSIVLPRYERPYVLPDEDTYRRCEHAAWLYKHWQPVPILATGGLQTGAEQSVAAVMRELLIRAGVPDSSILTENASRSTYENALFSTAILRRQGITSIVLVVEAFAMPRAEAVFRRQGLRVVPAPSYFRHLGSFRTEIAPSWKAIRRNEGILHEVLGLAWYRLRGWI